jgi:hypothetical protein
MKYGAYAELPYELHDSFKAANLPHQIGEDADNFTEIRGFPLHRDFDASDEGTSQIPASAVRFLHDDPPARFACLFRGAGARRNRSNDLHRLWGRRNEGW